VGGRLESPFQAGPVFFRLGEVDHLGKDGCPVQRQRRQIGAQSQLPWQFAGATELQPGVVRINATHCMDMIASEEERSRIAREVAGGESVWWMTAGWIKYRNQVFKGMDKAMANENFGRHSMAVVLDAVGYTEKYMEEKPEEFLDYSDWMGLPILPCPVALDRFKVLLSEAVEKLKG
jgi:hypothetical protein